MVTPDIEFMLKMLDLCENEEKHYRQMSHTFFKSANTANTRLVKPIIKCESSTHSSSKRIPMKNTAKRN